jgi:hypothetical protein
MPAEKRSEKRHPSGYYMRVLDDTTEEILGYLVETSPHGFKLETPKILEVNREYTLRVEHNIMDAHMPYIVFSARVVWCRSDPVNPFEYYAGFHIVTTPLDDHEIFRRIFDGLEPQGNR